MITLTKKPVLKLFALHLILGLLLGCQQAPKAEATDAHELQIKEMKSKQLRHIVLFKFKEDADPALIKNAETTFSALPNKISEITSFEWGLNNSPEGLNKGLTHCYLISFESAADRDSYLVHPDHLEFVELIGEIIEDATVVDYWTTN